MYAHLLANTEWLRELAFSQGKNVESMKVMTGYTFTPHAGYFTSGAISPRIDTLEIEGVDGIY